MVLFLHIWISTFKQIMFIQLRLILKIWNPTLIRKMYEIIFRKMEISVRHVILK
jgi:hypothetical protein